ncbi:MAG: GNAT family N-acetyltransferase [Desulfarculaceae bacterium]|nr:GNAT family N-acetyltransferase [Desulfarculaceae bacterium]MCF8046806.1 GNAT family N-acetyltransferase [Desulfarculaceae bacterium]MCF8097271.1 GNAT family N-acetyltransferase [Desulfarculaceae bacterium]
MQILVVNPPLGGPAAAPCASLRAASFLSGLEPLAVWDANLEFWNQRLLTGPADQAARMWRGQGFYDPASYLAARQALEERLDQAGQNLAQGRYGFAGLRLPVMLTLESLLDQAGDQGHPMSAWAADNLELRLPPGQKALVLLCLEVPGQCLGAAIMGLWLKKHRPEAVVALVGDCLEQAGAPSGPGPAWDHALSPMDPGPLRQLAASLTGQTPGKGCSLELASVSLQGFLSPAPVMSLRPVKGMELLREDPRDPGIAAPRFLETGRLVELIRQLAGEGVAGLLLTSQEMPAAYLEKLASELDGNQTPLGLSASLDDPPSPQALAVLARGGVRLIHWSAPSGAALEPGPLLAAMQKILVSASRAGLWNHLALPMEGSDAWAQALLDFTGSNPQVVHSWSRPTPWPWSPRPINYIGEPRAEAYRQVAPLPGGPLWRKLAGPAHLLLYLERHGCDAIRHWRVRPEGDSVYRLGENLSYVFAEPKDIAPEVLEEVALLVLAAGKVKPQWLRYNLANAYLVAYASEEGVIVGTDTLKRLRPEYLEHIKEQSGLDLTGYTERGYVSIRPEYRGTGMGNALVQGIISRAGGRKMVIITGEDNLAGQKLLARNNQRRVRTYFSKRLNKPMQIWMPQEQDPELGEEK